MIGGISPLLCQFNRASSSAILKAGEQYPESIKPHFSLVILIPRFDRRFSIPHKKLTCSSLTDFNTLKKKVLSSHEEFDENSF
jgi:hypothetical protein